MKTAAIQKLFQPKSIAVVGASRSKQKVGGVILDNLLSKDFRARIYAVNPNAEKVRKLKSYDSVTELPEIVDLAVIAVPSDFVEDAVLDCAVKGVKNIIIISSGYSEAGDDGVVKELALRKLKERYQLNLLGPNCLGLINSRTNLNLSFAHSPKKYSRGKISMISQSGAIGTAFLDWAAANNVETSKFVSLGNKIDLNENDFLEYFRTDDDTELILMYLETFQNGREFYELAKKVAATKSIVILKPGKTESSQKAMSAHTGALASSEKIVDQALKDSGCIRVNSLEELFNITKLFAWQPRLTGNRVAVITNAGGVGIDALDQLELNGLKVQELPENLQQELRASVKPNSSTKNPVDILGDALALDYKNTLKKVIANNEVDAVIVLLTPQLMTESLQTAKFINDIADKHRKVVVASFVGGEKVKTAIAYLNKEKLPHFNFAVDAAEVLGKYWQLSRRKEELLSSRLHYPTLVNSDLKVETPGAMLEENTTQKLLKKFGINYLPSYLFSNTTEIRKKEKNLKFPLVLKLKHPELIHKTELNAVRLPIYRLSELYKASKELEQTALKHKLTDYQLEIQPFIFQKIEVIVGVNKDSDRYLEVNGARFLYSKGFGHVLLLGAGGIYTEVMDDSALKLLPVNRLQALEMLKATKVGKILLGERRQNYNYKALLDLMVNLSRLIGKNSNISSIDLNPVFVTEHGAYAVDVKVIM